VVVHSLLVTAARLVVVLRAAEPDPVAQLSAAVAWTAVSMVRAAQASAAVAHPDAGTAAASAQED
jgi:hypothetical protein